MFYCEGCRKKNEWPESIMKSKGPCELCGHNTMCHDRPSGTLPPAKKRGGTGKNAPDPKK